MNKRFSSTFYICVCLIITVGSIAYGSSWENQLDVLLPKTQFTESQHAAIHGIFREAELKRIPTELLMPRLAEGVAKQVSIERITQVLIREIAAYDSARTLIFKVLGQKTGDVVLQAGSPWNWTVLLTLQGAAEAEITELLNAFNQQKAKDKWDNYRFGCSLYASLMQWGIDPKESLALVVAISKSAIPGTEYRGILDLIIAGTKLRVPHTVMSQRIIQTVPTIKSMEALETRVLY